MKQPRIVLAGHLGPLARAAEKVLKGSGLEVLHLEYPHSPEDFQFAGPVQLACFPFGNPPAAADGRRTPTDFEYLEALMKWALKGKADRIVLRSHAFAYGSSFKNYGLMEEDRVSLLPESASDQRWLKAETVVAASTSAFQAPPSAVLRFAAIADAGEADFLTHMLTGRLSLPWAGYDPRVQFLDLEDAAQALVQALLSQGTGLYNIAAGGMVAFQPCLRAAVPVRLPVAGAFQKPFRDLLWKAGMTRYPGDSLEQVRYNFTVSSAKAQRELGFEPRYSSAEALRRFLQKDRPAAAARIEDCDEFGLDEPYLNRFKPWFDFLRKIYWRVEFQGLEHIPTEGPAMVVSNHRGFMPFDAVMHRSEILEKRKRHIRFLVIPSLFKFPFLSDFLIKQGGVVASQQNSARLLHRGELVGIFPEGISGAFRMYKGAYQMGPMGRDVFARIAIENQVPVIPAVTVGHVEIFPILGKIHWPFWKRFTGWPFFPITPTFPFLPVPLPTKWHVRYLTPISVNHLRPEEASNPRVVRVFSEQVKAVMQEAIDDMLARRTHLFWGTIFATERSRGSSGAS